jgi:hypothetical protein
VACIGAVPGRDGHACGTAPIVRVRKKKPCATAPARRAQVVRVTGGTGVIAASRGRVPGAKGGPFYVGAARKPRGAEPRAIHKNRTANVGNQTDAAPKTGSLALTEVLPTSSARQTASQGCPPAGPSAFENAGAQLALREGQTTSPLGKRLPSSKPSGVCLRAHD